MQDVVIVTGASSGIGAATARLVGAAGAHVVVNYNSSEALAEGVVADVEKLGGKAIAVRANMGVEADIVRLFEETDKAFGAVTGLVNNAGVGPSVRADLLDATVESFDRVLSTNLRGPYFLTQAFARRVIQLHGHPEASPDRPVATIVNVSSISAETVSMNRGDYCVSKAGVAMATRLWAVRLATEGVVVYEVRPGIVASDMTAGVSDRYDAFFAAGGAPIARWGLPGDVAGAVSILVSGNTPYSTGEVFHVDGGMHLSVL